MRFSWRSRSRNTTLVNIIKTARTLLTRYALTCTCLLTRTQRFYCSFKRKSLDFWDVRVTCRWLGCWKNTTGSSRSAISSASRTPPTTLKSTTPVRRASGWRSWKKPLPSWRGTSTREPWTCWTRQRKGWGAPVGAVWVDPNVWHHFCVCWKLCVFCFCSTMTWWRKRELWRMTKQKSCRPLRNWTRRRTKLLTWLGRRFASILACLHSFLICNHKYFISWFCDLFSVGKQRLWLHFLHSAPRSYSKAGASAGLRRPGWSGVQGRPRWHLEGKPDWAEWWTKVSTDELLLWAVVTF